jgi:uncharacterized membrane protein
MWKLIVILIVALHFEAVGVILLSKGLKQIGEVQTYNVSEILGLVKRGLTNHNILLGVVFEAIFFVGLLMLMSRGDVSFVWPLTSLGFVITAVAARIFLHEDVSVLRWVGVMFIMLGAGVITYSEKLKEAQQAGNSSLQPVSEVQADSLKSHP